MAIPVDDHKFVFGFVYIWRDCLAKRFYIGSHKGNVDDGYICSSTRMLAEYRKRPDDFKRRILQFSYLDNDLLVIEQHWLDLIPRNEFGKKYYNYSTKARGFHFSSEISKKEVVEKIRIANTGKKSSNETKSKISAYVTNRFSDPEERRKQSIRLTGKKASPESIAKRKIKSKGNKSSRGYVWVTNGLVEYTIPKHKEIAFGFQIGRKKSVRTFSEQFITNAKIRMRGNAGAKGFCWTTDGVVDLFVKFDNIAVGFKRGRSNLYLGKPAKCKIQVEANAY
jgi:hypothetical protein